MLGTVSRAGDLQLPAAQRWARPLLPGGPAAVTYSPSPRGAQRHGPQSAMAGGVNPVPPIGELGGGAGGRREDRLRCGGQRSSRDKRQQKQRWEDMRGTCSAAHHAQGHTAWASPCHQGQDPAAEALLHWGQGGLEAWAQQHGSNRKRGLLVRKGCKAGRPGRPDDKAAGPAHSIWAVGSQVGSTMLASGTQLGCWPS